MTNERLIAALETAQKEVATPQTYAMLSDVITTLRGEIAAKAAKSAGKQDLYKAMLAVITFSKKYCPRQNELHGAWIDDGKQYVSNGHMLIENSGAPLDLPPLSDGVEPMNVQPIIKARAEKEYCDVLTCPTIAELKSGIKEQKELAKCNGHKLLGVKYRFGGGRTANAEYLQIAVQATGDTTIYAENHMVGRDNNYQSGKMWLDSNDGTVKVLVMSIRELASNNATGFDYSK